MIEVLQQDIAYMNLSIIMYVKTTTCVLGKLSRVTNHFIILSSSHNPHAFHV